MADIPLGAAFVFDSLTVLRLWATALHLAKNEPVARRFVSASLERRCTICEAFTLRAPGERYRLIPHRATCAYAEAVALVMEGAHALGDG